MLELYNTTNDIKRIPKYNYNGKFVIKPHEAVDILDDQAPFFKPYAKIGIVVRCKKDDVPKNAQTVKVNQSRATSGMLDLGISSNTVEETYSSPSYEEPAPEPEVPVEVTEVSEPASVEEVKEEVSELVEEVPVVETEPETAEPVKIWTEAELSEKSRDELRAIAKSVGLDCDTMGRKKDIQELILQKNAEFVE